jgi:hypothetical protein
MRLVWVVVGRISHVIELFWQPLGTPKSLEIQTNRPAEDREREIVFVSRIPFVRVQRRKPVLEMTFGFVGVRPVGPKVLREPETIDPVLKRISVHNVVADQ